jgi:hypothetical protein
VADREKTGIRAMSRTTTMNGQEVIARAGTLPVKARRHLLEPMRLTSALTAPATTRKFLLAQ